MKKSCEHRRYVKFPQQVILVFMRKAMIMLALGIWFLPSFSQSSEIIFDRLTTENTIRVKGLSQNSIHSLMQDSKGFMWIGTWDGLNFYDGYEFIVYNSESGLSNTTINALLEDVEKNIWIGTENGLNRLNRRTGRIDQWLHQPGNRNSLCNNTILDLYQDDRGCLWISTSFGLSCYDIDLDVFSTYNFFESGLDSLLTNWISRVIQDSLGMIWIATRNGIHCYNPDLRSFQAYKLDRNRSKGKPSPGNIVNDIQSDSLGNIWAATRNGIYVIQPGKGVTTHLKAGNQSEKALSDNHVNCLLVTAGGEVWIGTVDGLDVYNPERQSIRHFFAGGSTTSLSNNDVMSLHQDHSGTVWVGTYSGLNKADQSPSRFTHYFHDPFNPYSLSDNIVYSILEDENGLVWIGTFGGLNMFDRDNERFSVLRHDPANPASLSSDKIRCIALDSLGDLWVGTEKHGLNRLDRKSGRITRYQHDPGNDNSINSDEIFSLYVDRAGRVWVGTGNGIWLIDPSAGSFDRLEKTPLAPVFSNDMVVWAVTEDRFGNYWLGTTRGLKKLSGSLAPLAEYRYNPVSQEGIRSNWVFSIHEDSRGLLWIGTMGGGLARFDPVSETFKVFTEEHGLPNNVVYATLEDHENNLWISTNRGLSKFCKQTQTFVNYDTRDGIQGNEFNAGAYYQNEKGEIYFGGMNGFNVFHPKDIVKNNIPPRMVLTGFSVLNEVIDSELEGGEIFRLKHTENFFSITFSALDYTNPMKNAYRYRLENYDENWIYTDARRRMADYRKVNPGTYRFVVTGSNNDGVWNMEGVSLTVIVYSPWWQTWIFRLTVILLAIALLWSIIYFRIKAIKRKHEVEKKMLGIEKQVFELEQKALQLQMNPHFVFNSLNAIQNFVLANNTDKAVNYLAKFSHLMRMILANSTVAYISLKDELQAITYYMDLEKLRFDDKFDYEIKIDTDIDPGFILIPPMLLQPYIENAIIHGFVNSPRPGRLEITLKLLSPGSLNCVITDNGIGREKATEIRAQSGIKRQPRGMIITQERLEILNKQGQKNYAVSVTDLKDEYGNASGTRVDLTIQYKEL
ncbi:MAG: two-component regulator propeller domain-containing protein [Bacteroidales bacterium]